jgi:hypothetical protein
VSISSVSKQKLRLIFDRSKRFVIPETTFSTLLSLSVTPNCTADWRSLFDLDHGHTPTHEYPTHLLILSNSTIFESHHSVHHWRTLFPTLVEKFSNVYIVTFLLVCSRPNFLTHTTMSS